MKTDMNRVRITPEQYSQKKDEHAASGSLYLSATRFVMDGRVILKSTGERGIVTSIRFECRENKIVPIYEVDVTPGSPFTIIDCTEDEIEIRR